MNGMARRFSALLDRLRRSAAGVAGCRSGGGAAVCRA